MKNLYIIFIMLFFAACYNNDTQEAADQAAFKGVQLLCEDLGTQNGVPRSAVYAVLKDSKVKLAEIHSCRTVSPEEYQRNRIPEGTFIAVGGQADNHSEYVYAHLNEQDKNELHFYIDRVEGEGQYSTTTILASYKKGKFQLLRPLHLADIAGYYMHQGQDTSYVLFLGLRGPKLTAKLFATNEPIPAQKMLQRALPAFASTPDTDFDCELNTLVFKSSIGQGKVFWRPDSAAVIFNPFMNKQKEVVFELIQF